MALLHQSATYTRTFMMIQSSDHVTGLTGATVTVTLSKNGGAFAAAGGTVTEIASGLYKIALTTTDTNTLGDLAFHCTATSGDPTDFVDQVVAIDPQDGVHFGLTALPNAATGAAGGIITSGTGTAQISTTSGQVLLQTGTGTGQVNLSSGAVPVTGDLTATMKTSVENAVWNAAASSHTASGTFGQIVGAELVRTGTCQAGSTSTTIVFDSGASATDNWYKGTICLIISGTGSGQSRYVSSYTGSTKTATVANAWLTTPDATTVFMLMPYIYFSELVKAQMTTALTSDTITELSQAQPPVNPTISNAIMLLYMALRNQSTTTSTSFTISNDAGTVICKQTLSDDLTTFTAAKLVTGP